MDRKTQNRRTSFWFWLIGGFILTCIVLQVIGSIPSIGMTVLFMFAFIPLWWLFALIISWVLFDYLEKQSMNPKN